MIDESLIKSNFIGRDSFRWWVGQIAPIESLKGQNEDKGWGNRYKVRILGYHPFSKEDLSDEDLPYASVIIPPTAGTGGAQFAQSVRLRPSDVVMGFFLMVFSGSFELFFWLQSRSSRSSSNVLVFLGCTMIRVAKYLVLGRLRTPLKPRGI